MLNGVQILWGYFLFFFTICGPVTLKAHPQDIPLALSLYSKTFFVFFHIGGLCTPSTPFNITGECILAFIKAAVFKQRARPTAGPQSIVRCAAEARPDDHCYYCFVTSKKTQNAMCLCSAFLPCLCIPLR